jgi:hypothetical protein
MDTDHPTTAHPRAQGDQHMPWPAHLSGSPTTSCISLHVIQTQDVPGADVDVLLDLPRVAVGEATSTLRELINYRFVDSTRAEVLAEIDALGTIDPYCPLALERLQEFPGGVCVHLAALIVPVSAEGARELAELMDSEEDPQERHEYAQLWVEELLVTWTASADAQKVPVRYLEDARPAAATQQTALSDPDLTPERELVGAA